MVKEQDREEEREGLVRHEHEENGDESLAQALVLGVDVDRDVVAILQVDVLQELRDHGRKVEEENFLDVLLLDPVSEALHVYVERIDDDERLRQSDNLKVYRDPVAVTLLEAKDALRRLVAAENEIHHGIHAQPDYHLDKVNHKVKLKGNEDEQASFAPPDLLPLVRASVLVPAETHEVVKGDTLPSCPSHHALSNFRRPFVLVVRRIALVGLQYNLVVVGTPLHVHVVCGGGVFIGWGCHNRN